MSARHQCEATIYTSQQSSEVVAAAAVADSGRLPVLVFVLAAVVAAAVVVHRLQGLRMSADRMDDCTQKLQATVSAAVES